jgi:hypothetical protein
MKGRDYLGDLGIDGRTVFKWIWRKWSMNWIEWLGIGTNGDLLGMWYWTLVNLKGREIFDWILFSFIWYIPDKVLSSSSFLSWMPLLLPIGIIHQTIILIFFQ